MKYVMVLINHKFDGSNYLMRRVLVSYDQVYEDDEYGHLYKGTKLLAIDDYFKDKTKSHQYKFEDDGYSLLSCSYENYYKEDQETLTKKRPYHMYSRYDYAGEDNLCTEFQASSDEEAINIFNNRKELR